MSRKDEGLRIGWVESQLDTPQLTHGPCLSRGTMDAMRVPEKYQWAVTNLVTLSRRDYAPSLLVLFFVCLFWGLALFGGLELLSTPHSAVVTLGWLYLMLFLITASAAAGVFAVRDLARKARRRRNTRP
ncbi:MAG TPA: hypothetical protein VGN49_04355 [Micrococcaceae bacterium]|nr:hypothetical protein [Micrococcaceae bacterium]